VSLIWDNQAFFTVKNTGFYFGIVIAKYIDSMQIYLGRKKEVSILNLDMPKYTAFINGKIITINDKDEIAEAVLIADNKIAAVGSTEEIKSVAPASCEIVDLQGKSVIPGLIDGHVHASITVHGFEKCVNIQHPKYNTLEEMLSAIKERAEKTPKGEWIYARGSFDGQNKVKEKRFPTIEELDAISTEHPILIDFEVHMNVMNTYAMNLLGWTHETLIPKYASMGRDQQTGKPTGIFTEANIGFPPEVWGNYWVEVLRTGLKKHFVANGVTTIHEMPRNIESIRALQHLKDDGELPLRVKLYMMHNMQMPYEEFEKTGLLNTFGDPWLNLGGIKIFIDGCSYHANLHPYCDLKWTQEELDDFVYRVHKSGTQLLAHTLTPEGIEMGIKAYTKALKRLPRNDHRHRIEHAGDRIHRFAKQGVLYDTIEQVERDFLDNGIIPIVTPQFMRDNGPNMSPPLRTMIDRGYIIPGTTDATGSELETHNPWYGIWLAVTRKNIRGEVNEPEECITPMEAIKMFTKWAAWGGFEEKTKGSIEAGKLADMVILGIDPLTCEPDELRTMPVEAVMIDGKIKYKRDY